MEFEIGSPGLSGFPKMPILATNSLEKNILLSNDYQLKKDENLPNWNPPPFETNCYYNSTDNKVKIYAGFLFDSSTDENDYVDLYATIGRTISHEMTHAFYKTGTNNNKNDWKITY